MSSLKKTSDKVRVIIYVEGGTIEQVMSNNPDLIDVVLVDCDCDFADREDIHVVKYFSDPQDNFQAYIAPLYVEDFSELKLSLDTDHIFNVCKKEGG